jgi:hypothetical protein
LNFRRLLPVCLIGLLGAALPATASVVFSDSTFDLANYVRVSYLDNVLVTVSVTQCGSCGNPAQGLEIQYAYPSNPTFSSREGLINPAFTYNPQTQGRFLRSR